jgi:predicted RNA-binding Zn ribbon-like protein
MGPPEPILLSSGPLRRVGGAIAIDFVNTADWHLRPEPEERLLSYADLLAWAEGVGGLDRARAGRLARMATVDPDGAGRVLAEARRLREALFRVFLSIEQESAPARADLDIVNRWLAHAAPRRALEPAGTGLSWRWPEPESLESVLTPILWSAGDVLAGERHGRLKLCAAPDCGWLFLDASRRTSRLWCSMEGCGNRAKAQRHYRRRRPAAA